jgi:hypothetical protein
MSTIDHRAPEGGRPVSEMQRRIAEEIMNAEGTRDGFPSNRLDDLTPEGQGHYLMLALAAMKAMREPTVPMALAADDAVVEQYAANPEWGEAKDMAEGLIPSRIWATMVDAEISIAEGGKDDL